MNTSALPNRVGKTIWEPTSFQYLVDYAEIDTDGKLLSTISHWWDSTARITKHGLVWDLLLCCCHTWRFQHCFSRPCPIYSFIFKTGTENCSLCIASIFSSPRETWSFSFLSQEMVLWRWNRHRGWGSTWSHWLCCALRGSPWVRSTIYNAVVRHQCSGGTSCNYPNHFSTDLFPHSGMGLHSHW